MTQRIFIETSALTAQTMSGIGKTLLAILGAWRQDKSLDKFEVILLVPFDKKAKLEALDLGFAIKTMFIPDKILRGLRKFNLLPPLDTFLGKGMYLFPNYWNWPLKHSTSMTYIYDVSFLVDETFADPKNRAYLMRNIPVWIKRTDRVITISHHAKAEIMKYYDVDSKRIDVVYNGVDANFFHPESLDTVNSTKKKYDIRGKYLLFVGNIEPRKNISGLIAAYRQLPEKLLSEYCLVIIGADGWNNESIKKNIKSAIADGLRVQRVREYVSDEDLVAIYAGATILVHPAFYEGFGMTPLEAMATSTPVIVGENSSLPEVVERAGLYVNAQDASDISVKIRTLLENPQERDRLSRAGKAQVRKFTWQKTARSLAKSIEGPIDE